MKWPKNVGSDSKMNGSEVRLLADSSSEGKKFDRCLLALVVLGKLNH